MSNKSLVARKSKELLHNVFSAKGLVPLVVLALRWQELWHFLSYYWSDWVFCCCNALVSAHSGWTWRQPIQESTILRGLPSTHGSAKRSWCDSSPYSSWSMADFAIWWLGYTGFSRCYGMFIAHSGQMITWCDTSACRCCLGLHNHYRTERTL